ncbi:MAG: DUF4214 domain-containing protein [Acidobacteria bacterium]|nr:DUF4214 domain-containing protein [Acidobacteriota bacterium]
MRHPWKLPLAVVCLLAVAFFPLLPAPRGAAQAVTYTVTDLGTLGGAQSTALGLDECGKVVGESNPTGSTSFHPYFWNGATMTDLGTFGGQSGSASAVNVAGRVAGSAQTATSEQRPFIWTLATGTKADLGTPGTGAAAYDINESNQIVGQWETSPLQDRAFVWTQATGMQIVTAPWGTPIAAYAINNAGHIIGTAQTSGGASHAFLSSGGVVTDLGTLGGTNSFAYDLNEPDNNDVVVVVGHANIPSNNASRPFHAFRWTSTGGIQDLGTFGGTRSIAYGVNASGHIVGYAEVTAGVNRAFLWTDDNANGAHDAGEMKNLNTLAPTAGWTFEEARAINDRGQIVATAVNGSGQRRAFLLTPDNAGPSPCDIPGTLQFSAATYAAGEAGTNATVTVTRADGSDRAVSVSYATSNGTAVAGVDYTAAGGTLNFAAGETSKTFNVAVSDDSLDEPDETVNLTLSGPTGGATLGTQTTATLTITDNDAAPALSVNDVTVTEGNVGTTGAVFDVTLSAASAQPVTVNYSTADNSATQPADYASASGTLTFNPGDTVKTVNVNVAGDTTDEPNETFFVNLSSPSNATVGDGQGTGTITDDDGAPSLSVGDATAVAEGNAGATTAVNFTVSLLPASGQTVTVSYATADGTATSASGDYAAVTSSLTFDPGQTSRTITVNVNGDTVGEAHENFFLNLSSPSNATISDSQAQATVNNDDAALAINDLTIAEGNTGTTAFNFTVTLSHASVNPVSVSYATSDGTATAGSDYAAVTSGTVNFTPGDTSETVTINVTGEALFEANETFNVTLSSATGGATISDNAGLGTITNDDTAPSFTISDATVTEGNSGTVNATFTVTLSAPSGVAASVSYATTSAGGTATEGSGNDYTAASGTLNFVPGDTSETFTVTVRGETTFENNETFFVNLTSPSGATINDAQGVGTITNDDTAPTISINDPAPVTEGTANPVSITFTISLSAASGLPVTINYATANNTATAGTDYTAAGGTLTFSPGETTKNVAVSALGDALDEENETFFVNLSAASGASIADNSGVGTITDDDAAPSLTIEDTTVEEGAGVASFNFKLSAASGRDVLVLYTSANGTATAGADYMGVGIGSVTFSPGETSKTVSVDILNDTTDEPDETFSLNVHSSSRATIGDGTGVGTISDNDVAPSLSVGDATVTEGDAGTVNATFAVTLSAASGKTVTVSYATANNTAVAPGDYAAVASTQLTFNPGETSKNVTVLVAGDTTDEPNESFDVNLSGASNATVNDGQGTGTITDDDGAPSLSVGDVTVTEGNSGGSGKEFTVTLAPASGQTVTVNYATADGTARADAADYAAASGTITFNPGETSKTFLVFVLGDTLNEADENFFVNLSGASNAGVADARGVGTILNDDTPRFQFSEGVYPVGESAHFVTVTVTRSGDASAAANVDFATGDGTATERKDYTAASGTLRFAAGETSKTFDVLLTEDAFTEPVETINLTLSNPTGGAALGPQAAATVLLAADDDPPPAGNPIDNSSDFVRQHYHDFLNREPDAAGLAFWTGGIESCGADAACREVKRINTSAAFFLSIEFQETGYFVYRAFKAAYGDATSPGVGGTVPFVRLQEFLPDTRRIGEGVVVGPGDWQAQLEANKNAYMLEFVQRPRFLAEYPLSMDADNYLRKLAQNAGITLTGTDYEQTRAMFRAFHEVLARAAVLRMVAEKEALQQAELRRAFVLMQYFGYLRRNPDDAPEPGLNYGGWNFWLGKLNEFGGDPVRAEMVKAFLDSAEYRNRFGQ